MLSDGGASGHQTDSLPGCLGFDLRYDDVSTREIPVLTSTLSCVRENRVIELMHRLYSIVSAKVWRNNNMQKNN